MGWNVSVGWKNMPCITFHREPTVWAGMYLWAGKICLVSLSIESLQWAGNVAFSIEGLL